MNQDKGDVLKGDVLKGDVNFPSETSTQRPTRPPRRARRAHGARHTPGPKRDTPHMVDVRADR